MALAKHLPSSQTPDAQLANSPVQSPPNSTCVMHCPDWHNIMFPHSDVLLHASPGAPSPVPVAWHFPSTQTPELHGFSALHVSTCAGTHTPASHFPDGHSASRSQATSEPPCASHTPFLHTSPSLQPGTQILSSNPSGRGIVSLSHPRNPTLATAAINQA